MDDTFDVSKYLSDLGKDLVYEYLKAGDATHPGAVGDAREKSICHGHPSLLHLWWARRLLVTACAAYLQKPFRIHMDLAATSLTYNIEDTVSNVEVF
jgi:hypothetical protein